MREVAKQLASGDGKVYGAIMYIWGSSQVMPADQRGLSILRQTVKLILMRVSCIVKLRKELERGKGCHPIGELKATKTHYSKAFGMVIPECC